jgi:hypothetical protein
VFFQNQHILNLIISLKSWGAIPIRTKQQPQGADYKSFGNNFKVVSDYLYQNIPIMKGNKGFDLNVTLFDIGGETYQNESL